jgi:hypothetical protein
MRTQRVQAIGIVMIALLVLAVVLIRYGGTLPWGAR